MGRGGRDGNRGGGEEGRKRGGEKKREGEVTSGGEEEGWS